jgi:hypothetical protein
MRSTSVHAFKRGDGTAGEQPSKVMVFYINTNDVEFGVKLDEQEVIAFGAGMASMIEDGSLKELMDALKSAFENKADEQEEEKSEAPEEEATDEESESDIDPVRIHCRTYGNLDSVKFKIVKDYLRKNGIDMIKGISPTGRDEVDYYLWPHQVKELTDLIDQDEDTYSDGKILI